MNSTAISISLRDKLTVALIFLASLACFFLLMDRSVNVYDEGLILTGAMRVAAGDMPHRDFYANYGPATFYPLAWLFDFFGQRAIVERLLDLTIRAAIAATIYATLIVYSRRAVALVMTGTAAIWLCFSGAYGYPVFPVLLLALAGSAIMARVLAGDALIRHAFAGGVLTGVAALFRYDVGVLIFLAHVCAILITTRLANRDLQLWRRQAWPIIARYTLGAAIIVIPLLAWYWGAGAFSAFFHDIVLYPAKYYARTRNTPFPSLATSPEFFRNITIYLPLIILPGTAVHLYIEKSRTAACFNSSTPDAIVRKRDTVFLVVFGLLSAFCYTKGLVRVSTVHLILSIIPSFMLLAVLTGARLNRARTVFVGAWLLVALSCVTALHQGYWQTQYLRWKKLTPYHELANGNWLAAPRLAIWWDRGAVISFIRDNTRPGERIYVGLGRHDKILFNDNLLYFMTGRMPATHWHHFDPGLQTRADIQTAMIKELERWQPRYAVLDSSWDEAIEPNESARSSGVTLLDNYLHAHYHPIRQSESLVIWQRNGTGK
jgi:hypothetical protein